MDYYSANKIFSRMLTPKTVKKYVLSEDVVDTLKRWEVYYLTEGAALVRLERMLHTAPASEKDKIRKAIAALRKKEAKSVTVDRGDYVIYKNWGKDSDLVEEKAPKSNVNPDTWYSEETKGWANKSVIVFVYVPETDFMIYADGSKYTHMDIVRRNVFKGKLTLDDLGDLTDNELWNPSDDLEEVLFDIDLQENGQIIHGRTGPLPIRADPIDDVDFCVSIWNYETEDYEPLDKMMEKVNKTTPRKFNFDILFHP